MRPPFTTALSDSTAAGPRAAHAAVVLALFVGSGALTRMVVMSADIVNHDEASYIVGSWELLHGRLPYTDFADNKPPLIYVYYAATQLLAGHGMVGVRLATTLVTLPLTAFALSAFYHHRRRGLVAGLLYLLYSAAFVGNDMLAVNCELVMLLPLAWALVLVRDQADAFRPRRLLGAGLLIGVATLVKYQAALWLPAVTIAVALECWSTDRRALIASLAALATGFAVPLVATWSVFMALGGLEGFVYWNVTHNVMYLENPTTAQEVLRRLIDRLLPFLVVTIVLWWGWIRSASLVASRYWTCLISGLILTSLAAGFLGWRFFPHYFVQLYVPLAVGAAPWVEDIVRRPIRTAGWVVSGYTMLVFGAFTAANAVRYLRPAALDDVDAASHLVANRLHADRCYQGASLFVWGSEPLFYYHSGLPVASRFFFPEFPLVNYVSGNPAATSRHFRHVSRRHRRRWYRRQRHWNWLMADLKRNEPTYILDMAPATFSRWQDFPLEDYPWLERFVRTRYESLGSIHGVDLYRQRDCAPLLPGVPGQKDRTGPAGMASVQGTSRSRNQRLNRIVRRLQGRL